MQLRRVTTEQGIVHRSIPPIHSEICLLCGGLLGSFLQCFESAVGSSVQIQVLQERYESAEDSLDESG